MSDNYSELINAGYVFLGGALALGIVKRVFKDKPFKPKDSIFKRKR